MRRWQWPGRDSETRTLLTRVLRHYRGTALLSVSAGIVAALLEGTTLVVFTSALEMLLGNDAVTDLMGPLSDWLAYAAQRVAPGTLFVALIVVAVILQVMRSGFDYVSQAAAGHLRISVEGEMRQRVFGQFITMSLAETSRMKTGDQVTYFEDASYIGAILETALRLTRVAFLLLVYVGVLFWISWPATLVALAMLALFAWPIRRTMKALRQISKRVVAVNVRIKEDLVDYLAGMRVIHTYTREASAIAEVDEVIVEGVKVRRRNYLTYLSINPLFETLAVVGMAALLALTYATAGIDSVPRLLVFVFVLYRLMPRFTVVNSLIGAINMSWPHVTRVAELLRVDDKAYVRSGAHRFDGLVTGIRLRCVSFAYPGVESEAIRELACSLPANQMTAVVGISGGGKSTLVNLLLRLYDPTAGTIEVDGVDLCELDLDQWRQAVGVVEQDPFLFHDTVDANIGFGRVGATQAQIEDAARVANAYDFVARLPQGFQTLVGARGHRLSGGERQRIAIARAIIDDPPILIMDEATSNLDSRSEQLIQQSLQALRHNRTLIVIAHRLSTVAIADNILVLDGGQLVEQGTHTQLLQQGNAYAELWNIQTAGREPARSTA